MYPVQVSSDANGRAKLERRREHEHGCEKLGQYLPPGLCNDAAWLGLVPVEQKAVEALALRVAFRLAYDSGIVVIELFKFTHSIADYTKLRPRPGAGYILLHGGRATLARSLRAINPADLELRRIPVPFPLPGLVLTLVGNKQATHLAALISSGRQLSNNVLTS